MSEKLPSWKEYWSNVSGKLERYINERRNLAAENFLVQSLGFYSYLTEDFETKVTKNKKIVKHTFPLVVELHDLLRGMLFAQRNLLLATSALQLRTAFEIRTTLKYIFQQREPAILAKRLTDYYRYEQIVGSRLSPTLSYEGEVVERAFAKKHPYWSKKSGLLKDSADWSGEGKSLKDICLELDMGTEYFQIYKTTSKFSHGSPLVRNQYGNGKSLGCLPTDGKAPTRFSLIGALTVDECLKEYCLFFGVDFPENEYQLIQEEALKAMPNDSER